MTLQVISVGSSPNDGTGDPLRTGGQKINAMFAELYAGRLAGTADNSTNNVTALTTLLAAIPAAGGIGFIPPAPLAYRINSTVSIADRKSIVIEGFSGNTVDATNNEGYSSLIRVGAGWGSTTAMFLITGTSGAVANAKGGHSFRGLALHAGLGGAGTGGYGFEITKPSATSDFWGDLEWIGGWIFNANIGLYFHDGGNGIGFVRVDGQRLQACNYGLLSDVVSNDWVFTAVKARQNEQASNSSYLTRSGGAFVFTRQSQGLSFFGCNTEGSQVGYHFSGTTTGPNGVHIGITIKGGYNEATHDALAVFHGADDCSVEDVYTDNGAQRQKHIYVQNCKRITQQRNNQSFFIVAPHCRDLVTDTPELTRFTITTAGSQTLEDYGFWIHSVPSKQPLIRPPRSAHYQVTSISPASTTIAASTKLGPHGQRGKTLRYTSTGSSDLVQFDTETVTVAQNQFAVLSVWLHYPTTNDPTSNSGSFEFYEDINAGGFTSRASMAISRRCVSLGEWVLWQWVHKVQSGETSIAFRIRTKDGGTVGDPYDIGGIAFTVTDTPAVDPLVGVISCEADGSEFQYFIPDGNGRFFSSAVVASAKPTGSLLTWYDGEEIDTLAQVSAAEPGWRVSVTGNPGSTARFCLKPVLGSETT